MSIADNDGKWSLLMSWSLAAMTLDRCHRACERTDAIAAMFSAARNAPEVAHTHRLTTRSFEVSFPACAKWPSRIFDPAGRGALVIAFAIRACIEWRQAELEPEARRRMTAALRVTGDLIDDGSPLQAKLGIVTSRRSVRALIIWQPARDEIWKGRATPRRMTIVMCSLTGRRDQQRFAGRAAVNVDALRSVKKLVTSGPRRATNSSNALIHVALERGAKLFDAAPQGLPQISEFLVGGCLKMISAHL